MGFRDRTEAGKLLAEELTFLEGQRDVIVLAIPRGGVVVGYQVAKRLKCSLGIYITRKLGAPGNPELAIGAVASDGGAFVDEGAVRQLGVDPEYLEAEIVRQREEIGRRLARYWGDRTPLDIKSRTVVLVDDGVATGATITASITAIRRQEPAQLILAIPVGPPDTMQRLEREVDRLVVLHVPALFWAVGEFYQVFDQTSDGEVIALLDKAGQELGQPGRDQH
jgi:putative phosphoribosyl transferase